MFSKIIFVLATVCVVNASVITDNVFDDDPQTEMAADPKICNLQACNQLCRRLKFPGGACVNGRCKCDRLLNAEDGVSEISLSDLEDSVSQKDDPDTEFATKPSRCHLKLCNLACRILNKTSGACVDDRCKCAETIKTGVTQELLSNPEDFVSPRACNNQKCNQLCRKKKFRGGACLGANCYCNKFLSLQDEDMTDSSESLSLNSCNSIACDDQCRRTGWHSGVCVNGQCKCDYFLNTEDAVSETLSNVEDDVSPKRCTQEACNNLCRKLKFQEGVCISSRCRCKNYTPLQKDALTDLAESRSLDDEFLSDNFLDTEDAVDEYSELVPRRVCRLRRCNRTCTRRGFEGARCVNGVCECYNKTQKEPSLLKDVTNDEQEDFNLVEGSYEEELLVPSPRACSPMSCSQKCRRLKYPGGWCIAGICQCL